MERIIQKNVENFLVIFLVVGVFVIPNLSLAVGVSSQCSSNGYTVATINGVFTDEKRAQENMDALKLN